MGGVHDARLFAALALHGYLSRAHWDGDALRGPDAGVRLTYRLGRFVKSYARWLPWRDALYYLQGQAYWTLGNWQLFELVGETRHRDIAVRAARRILETQRGDGAWDYPNPAWKGRVATTEGTWASLALLETFRQTGDGGFLDGALRWNRFLRDHIGFQPAAGGLAVNYFAGRAGAAVPNNTAFVLRLFAELAAVTSDDRYRRECPALVGFMAAVQRPNGEFPYTVATATDPARHEHFQCFQYNAFQCLDLIRVDAIAPELGTRPLVEGVLRFLRSAIAPDGAPSYDCRHRHPNVTYHAAVAAAAFAGAGQAGIAGYDEAASRAYAYVLSQQRPDGSFPHSRRDYRLLSDRRSYPRPLAMILCHLLSGVALAERLRAGAAA
jgi:hypothetical protein